jgi:hypothetical protein
VGSAAFFVPASGPSHRIFKSADLPHFQTGANKYGVRGIPTMVLVDKEGVIQWLQVGYASDDNELEQKVKSLVEK